MIPAGARFVQLGRFDAAEAEAVMAALRVLGYPVARERKAEADARRLVLAGPFSSRERLVAALNRLREAGYTTSVAR